MAINSLSASSHGLSGLVTGADSQQMVQKLLSGTQSKIDKAKQRKSVLQFKQEMYRDVGAKLTALQTSFLSFSSKTNLMSNAFYNTMKTSISPPTGTTAAFAVTGSSSAKPGTVTMDYIKQLATARTAKTNVDASGSVIGSLDQSAAAELLKDYSGDNAELTIKVGGQSISFPDAVESFGGKSPTEVVDAINKKFKEKTIDAEARFVNNKLQIKAGDSQAFITIHGSKKEGATALATRMFGMVEVSGQGTLNANIDTDAYLPGFEVNLDGRQQTIRMDVNALRNYAKASGATDIATTRKALVAGMSTQMERYFGTGATVGVNETTGDIEFGTGVKSQKITVTGSYKNMAVLGVKSGISNKLNTNMALKDLNFRQDLQGDQHTFKINGVQFSFSGDKALSSVMNEINNSKAGVKISYLESEDRFVMQSSETGSGSMDFMAEGAITQSEGNLMTVLFGTKSSNLSQGRGLTVNMTSKTQVDAKDIADGGTFTFNINGVDRKFKITRDKDSIPFTHVTFAKEMNKAFKDNFGNMPDGTQKVEFVNDSGKFTIRVNAEDTVVKTVKTDATTNTKSLGFEVGQSTVASSGSMTLANAGIHFGEGSGLTLKTGAYTYKNAENADVTVAAKDIELTAAELNAATSLDDLAKIVNDKIKASYDPALADKLPTMAFDAHSGGFRLLGVEIPMEIVIKDNDTSADDKSTRLGNLFGKSSLGVGIPPDLGEASKFAETTDQGKNAVFSLNNSILERATNTFTIEGLTYTLQETTVTKKDTSGNPIEYQPATKIAVTRDTEQVVTGIQEFLKLYNETIDYINDIYKSEATYKEYAPLTSEQRNNMSDREVELWEKKSKEGLLRNDPLLDRVLSSMRKAMYTKPEESSIAIYDLGIATSFYSKDGNFNAKSPEDMRSAIEADPEAVRQLFAGEGGIMTLLNDALNTASKSSYGSPGYLTAVAGSNALDTTSSIYNQIKDVDKQLGTLEKRYWSEYNRYWKQFNTMENLIQKMNSQSSWLTQQMG